MRSIRALPLLIGLIGVGSLAATPPADATPDTIYARYAPMFRYWCLSAEQRYAHERPIRERATSRERRVETCERLAAIYSDRLKKLALGNAEADDDRIIEIVQFIGQACIDMQVIGTGRARAEGSCPLADRPENDRGARIEEVFGPYALQNSRRQFEWLGRRHLLEMFPPGSRASALTNYLRAHHYRCRADQARMITQYRCSAEYGELLYERLHASMLGASLPSVTYHERAYGRLDDIVVSRFDEGQAVFGPYPNR
jgi:hypothetical protein